VPCRGIEPATEHGRRASAERRAVDRTPAMPRSGIEPGHQPTGWSCSFEHCCAIRHTRKALSCKYPDLDSNQGPDLRRVRCNPLHHRDPKPSRADGWIRTSISLFTRQAPFYVEPRRQARARGVEPRPSALETDCSPRSTLASVNDQSKFVLAAMAISTVFLFNVCSSSSVARL
jgi:hypothetical protein